VDGRRRRPSSTVGSASFAPIFAAIAAIGLIPLFFYFRGMDRG
jgi:hypothetical protein